ncbi:MAG: hypothetical protein ACO3UU_14615 [Minisyncoccia bacterium]
MKLIKLGNNETLLQTNHGYEILYSYETPVAGYSPLLGHFKTTEHYSATTTKHINKYLKGNEAFLISPTDIERMGFIIAGENS